MIGASGATLDTNNTTILGNLTGAGLVTCYGEYGYGGCSLTLAGNNSGFSGGISVPGGSTLALGGSSSSGTGPITLTGYYSSANLNLLSDTSTAFITSNLQLPGYATTNINVDQLTSAGANNTLTFNTVTPANWAVLNITGSHGYILSMGTMTVSGALQLNPTTANVAIGTLTGSLGYNQTNPLTLGGGTAASGTIGTINVSGGNGPSVSVTGGVWTLTGPSTYSVPTVVSGGRLVAAYTTNSTTASSFGTSNLTLNGGTLASIPGATSYILGTVTAGSGAHAISPGGDGTIGTLAVAGGLTLDSNTSLSFDIASKSSLDQVLDGGALSFSGGGSANVLVSPVSGTGTYKLMTFSPASSINLGDLQLGIIGGAPVPTTYSLNLTPTELDLDVTSSSNNSTLALSATSLSLRAMVNNPTTTSAAVSETSGIASAFTATPGSSLTVNPASGTLAASGSQMLTVGYADYSTTGPRTDTVVVNNTANTADPFNFNGTNTIAVSGAVVDNRVVTASPVNAGIHAGATSSVTAVSTLSTTGGDNYFTRVTVGTVTTPDANGFTAVGGIGVTFNSATSTDTRYIVSTTPLSNPGTSYSGSFTLVTTGEGLPGESPVNVTLPYTITVFSGNANWTNSGGDGTWANDLNWTDAASTATLGAPGLAGAASIGDQANFLSGSSGTVTLNNASPHIAMLTMAGTGGYTIAQGTGSGVLHLDNGASGVSLTVSNTQAISAAVSVDSATQVNTAGSADQLTMSGNISGSGSLTKIGSGTLAIANGVTNGITGGLFLNGGSYIAYTAAAMGGSGNAVTFSGGTLNVGGPPTSGFQQGFLPGMTLDATHAVTVNAGGGTITQPEYTNQGANPTGIVTIAGNISGTGPLTAYCLYGYPSLKLSGNNSAFSGGITIGGNGVLELDGPNSMGTGPIDLTGAFTNLTLNLRSDSNDATFAAPVVFGDWIRPNINVDQLTSAGSGNTLILNSVTANNPIGGTWLNAPLYITGDHGYSLSIGTLNAQGLVINVSPSVNVAIGTFNLGNLAGYQTFTLSGTSTGNTIGSVLSSGGGGGDEFNVASGTWTLTGTANYPMPTVLSGGALVLGPSSSVPNSTLVVSANNTLLFGPARRRWA